MSTKGVWTETLPDGTKKRRTTPEYRAWQSMRNRCFNKRTGDYRYYGGRGITVCSAWSVFSNFLSDMGLKPSPLHTLDRIDRDGNYCVDNCRWATRLTQARNRDYASTQAWLLADMLGISVKTANHMIWQVRNKHGSAAHYFGLSPEREAVVVSFLNGGA